jgi:hypothetical protein
LTATPQRTIFIAKMQGIVMQGKQINIYMATDDSSGDVLSPKNIFNLISPPNSFTKDIIIRDEAVTLNLLDSETKDVSKLNLDTIILAFSLNMPKTYMLKDIVSLDLQKKIKANPTLPIILLGVDVTGKTQEIDQITALNKAFKLKEMLNHQSDIEYRQCSLAEKESINEVFKEAAKIVLKRAEEELKDLKPEIKEKAKKKKTFGEKLKDAFSPKKKYKVEKEAEELSEVEIVPYQSDRNSTISVDSNMRTPTSSEKEVLIAKKRINARFGNDAATTVSSAHNSGTSSKESYQKHLNTPMMTYHCKRVAKLVNKAGGNAEHKLERIAVFLDIAFTADPNPKGYMSKCLLALLKLQNPKPIFYDMVDSLCYIRELANPKIAKDFIDKDTTYAYSHSGMTTLVKDKVCEKITKYMQEELTKELAR